MELQQRINQEIKKAMQEKSELLLLVLRGINAAIKNKEIEKRTKLSKTEKDIHKLEQLSKLNDEETIEVIAAEAKKRKDAIVEFQKGNRNDLVEKEQRELEIINQYLPKQMDEEEVRKEAEKVIKEINATGPRDTGKVMASLMPKIKGRADGSLVSKVVAELLKS